jgi:Flagellar hook-length control protein FliK
MNAALTDASPNYASSFAQVATASAAAILPATDPAASADGQPVVAGQTSAATQIAGSVLAASQAADMSAARLSADPLSRNQLMPDQPDTDQTSLDQTSLDQTNTDQTSTDQTSTDQAAPAVASVAVAAAASVPGGLSASAPTRQQDVTEGDSAQDVVVQSGVPSVAAVQSSVVVAGSAFPSSANGTLAPLGPPVEAASGIASVQASIPSNVASASQTSPETMRTQSPIASIATSSTGANILWSKVEPNAVEPSKVEPNKVEPSKVEPGADLPSLSPPLPTLDPKLPPLPQPASTTLSAAKPGAPAPTSPSAVHDSGNSGMPRLASELRLTPTPSDGAPDGTQGANWSSSSSAVSLSLGGNLSVGKNLNLTPNPGNQFSQAHASIGSAPSEGAAPAVNATGAAEDNSQSGTDADNTSDALQHKTTSPASTQIVAPAASSILPAGTSLADPAAPTAIQTAITATPLGIPVGAGQGSTGPSSTAGAAHAPDSRAAAGSDSSPNLVSAELGAHPSTGPVQMAQMVNQAAQSEMRIGMNTAAFGNVEVRTVVHANDVGVLIGSEKGDLRSLLANELPGIAASLQQQNLRLNQVNFHQTGFAFSNQMSTGGDAQPRSFSSRSMAAAPQSAEAFSGESSEPSAASSAGSGAGLSILA